MANEGPNRDRCVLCRNSARLFVHIENDTVEVRCDRCGHFLVTDELLRFGELEVTELYLLSGCAREQSELDAREPLIITTKNYRELIDHAPQRAAEQAKKLLAILRRKSEFLGKKVALAPERDYPLGYARNLHEFKSLLDYLEKEGSIERHGRTPGGWEFALTLPAFDATESGVPLKSASSDVRRPAVAKKHVFLCYCRDNAKEVAQLRDDLIGAGEQVWWDREILGGQEWKHEIRKAMKEAYAVVACFSKETAARATSGIYPELEDAVKAYRQYAPGSVFLIPVRLSDCSIPDIEISDTKNLESLHYIDLFPPSKRAEGVEHLIQSLREAPERP